MMNRVGVIKRRYERALLFGLKKDDGRLKVSFERVGMIETSRTFV